MLRKLNEKPEITTKRIRALELGFADVLEQCDEKTTAAEIFFALITTMEAVASLGDYQDYLGRVILALEIKIALDETKGGYGHA